MVLIRSAGEAEQELREGPGADRPEPDLLAAFHPTQMQAALHQDHPVPDPDAQAGSEETVSSAGTLSRTRTGARLLHVGCVSLFQEEAGSAEQEGGEQREEEGGETDGCCIWVDPDRNRPIRF